MYKPRRADEAFEQNVAAQYLDSLSSSQQEDACCCLCLSKRCYRKHCARRECSAVRWITFVSSIGRRQTQTRSQSLLTCHSKRNDVLMRADKGKVGLLFGLPLMHCVPIKSSPGATRNESAPDRRVGGRGFSAAGPLTKVVK